MSSMSQCFNIIYLASGFTHALTICCMQLNASGVALPSVSSKDHRYSVRNFARMSSVSA
jgi:hypothetical protein